MKLQQLVDIIGGRVVCGNALLDREVEYAFASDLMSDVLTVQNDNMILITGLSNLQAIRTAEMSDIGVVVFVRNKPVSEEMVRLGNENGMVLIECPKSMFNASGLLFANGLKPVY